MSVKILHTADWHLGKMIYGRSLLEDQAYFLNHIFLPVCDDERPDAVILAGDIFDRQIAPVDAIHLFDELITNLCGKRKIPLIALAGNHDGAGRITLGADLLRDAGFYYAARPQPDARPFALETGGRPVHIYALPYFTPFEARELLGPPGNAGESAAPEDTAAGDAAGLADGDAEPETLRTYDDAYRALLSRIRDHLDPGAVNLLAAHCYVTGAGVSDGENPFFIGGSGEVSADVFAGFGYAALGHLHRPQTVRPERSGCLIRYAGSPLPYSFDEAGYQKSLTLLEINDSVTVREIPVQPRRGMRVVRGSLAELEAAPGPAREDYVEVVLEGPPLFEPMARLRQTYPNILSFRYGEVPRSETDNGLKDALRDHTLGDMEIFDAFMRNICGEEPAEDDRRLYAEAVRRADGEPDIS